MVGIPKKYILAIDDDVKNMARKDALNSGVDEFMAKACKYLDCSRVIDGMRMMQTIGTPYQYEMGKAIHGLDCLLEQGYIDENKYNECMSKLVALHKRNLKYEEDNPPIIYDKKKGLKKKTTRTTRKKPKEGTLEGFEKPKKPSAKEVKAQLRADFISKLKYKL